MFENYSNSQKTRARADYKAAKAIFDSMRNLGKDNAEIKIVLESMLAGKLWKDEIINGLFNPYNKKQENKRRWDEYQRTSYERNHKRWEEEARRHQEYRWRENLYTGSSLFNEALGFFGFVTMPVADELKRKYRELCFKHHPDKGGDTATFQRLQNYKDLLFTRAGI